MLDSTEPLAWNGRDFVPCGGIPISDRGFRYGMALFESFAVRHGRVEFLNEHLDRLAAACRQCGWPVYTAAFARAGQWLRRLSGPSFARIYVTAGDGNPATPVQTPRVLLFSEPRDTRLLAEYRIVAHSAPHVPVLGGLKTANYWANLESLAWARHGGFDEALLFNPDGALISACMANVFVMLGGEWITPHPATGTRPGVVREWVMQRYSPGKIVQRALTLHDLDKATECFLTSSWIGVLPVAALDMRPLQTTVSRALRAEFLEAMVTGTLPGESANAGN